MNLKIKDKSFFESRYLQITPTGVIYYKAALTGKKRHFRFNEIDAILVTDDGTLSFQVGRKVYSIRTKPAKTTHQQLVLAFVDGVRRSVEDSRFASDQSPNFFPQG